MKRSLRLASIDIGTNSTRLLVAECDGTHTQTLDRRMAITRLGEGVDRTRRLLPGAIERTAAALRDYRALMDRLRPEGVRAAATSALRDVESGRDFLSLAEEIIGKAPEILSGEEEARISFLGAVSDLSSEDIEMTGPVLVFDIGGGSTELIVRVIGNGNPPARKPPPGPIDASPLAGEDSGGGDITLRSVDVGCVRMSERFLASDPPSPVALGRMESYIVGRLKSVMEEIVPAGLSLAVGLAGTVTTLSAINQGLTEYDTKSIHHSRLTRPQVEELFLRLSAVGVEQRKRVMGLEPERADIIIGGAAVLRAVMDIAGLDEILVSEKDILDGLVIDLYRTLT